ncbi:uncharacterized protein A4U43_C02F20370 [Asparagus officinalis]|uniref:Knottin scorpion toxin-like domain-containing protein n=1 Tax=Asparagus officinalis TaxID=4686 RepID=A0A5P1FJV8_ASPOF|nr:uncharacterized protein A4U43_C02F20370 [Asparagus officinalis]
MDPKKIVACVLFILIVTVASASVPIAGGGCKDIGPCAGDNKCDSDCKGLRFQYGSCQPAGPGGTGALRCVCCSFYD